MTITTTTAAPARPAIDPAVRRRRHRNRQRLRRAIVLVILIPLALAWIYPFVWMVSASLKANGEVFGTLNPLTRKLHLDNYVRAWTEARIGQYFVNTVIVTGGSIIISVTATALIGYVLGRYWFHGKRIVIGLFAAAIFLPEGYTIIPIFDLISRLHLDGTLWGLTLAEAGGAHVVAVLLFAGYFRQLPAELEEAAMLDGASFPRVFARIYLPLAKPVIATAIILQFMHAWNDFLLPLVLTLARPELRTLAVGVYSFQGLYFNDWSGMAAAATIALIPIIAMFLVLQRYFVESVAGAMKG